MNSLHVVTYVTFRTFRDIRVTWSDICVTSDASQALRPSLLLPPSFESPVSEPQNTWDEMEQWNTLYVLQMSLFHVVFFVNNLWLNTYDLQFKAELGGTRVPNVPCTYVDMMRIDRGWKSVATYARASS